MTLEGDEGGWKFGSRVESVAKTKQKHLPKHISKRQKKKKCSRDDFKFRGWGGVKNKSVKFRPFLNFLFMID